MLTWYLQASADLCPEQRCSINVLLQIVPDCIAHAPAHTDVYLQFPSSSQAHYQHKRSAAHNKDDFVRALPATAPAQGTMKSTAAPSAVPCQSEAKLSTSRQALLAAATAELADLHELMLGCADHEKQTKAELDCDDIDDIQLLEMHSAACTCFSGKCIVFVACLIGCSTLNGMLPRPY